MGKNTIDYEKVTRYRDMYNRKLITDAQLQKLVAKGVITQEEYQLIIADINE